MILRNDPPKKSGDHDAFSTYHRRLLSYCRRSPSRSLVEVERCGPGEVHCLPSRCWLVTLSFAWMTSSVHGKGLDFFRNTI
jgi:hypothetical protein